MYKHQTWLQPIKNSEMIFGKVGVYDLMISIFKKWVSMTFNCRQATRTRIRWRLAQVDAHDLVDARRTRCNGFAQKPSAEVIRQLIRAVQHRV